MAYDHWFPILATNVLNTKCLLCRLKNGDGSIRYEIVFLNEEEFKSYQATMCPEKFNDPNATYKTTWEDRFLGLAKNRVIFVCGAPRNDMEEKVLSKTKKQNNDIATWSVASSVKPTERNVFLPSTEFNAQLKAQSVKEGMDMPQVMQILGQPKEIRLDSDLELWFYTYEFPDRTGEDRWMILMVKFKAGRTISEGFWVPNR